MYREEKRIFSYFDKKFLNEVLGIAISKDNQEEAYVKLKEVLKVKKLSDLNELSGEVFCKRNINKTISEKEIILKNAWINLALMLAEGQVVNDFKLNSLLKVINTLKSLSLNQNNDLKEKITFLLNKVGIKFVVLPYLPLSNIRGFVKYLKDEGRYVLAINNCGKLIDKFFFTLFHEIAHIILDNIDEMKIEDIYITYEKVKEENNEVKEIEEKADIFAKDMLIHPDRYEAFIRRNNFTIRSMLFLANKEKVDIGIVIGRLQKDGYLSYSQFNNYKRKIFII